MGNQHCLSACKPHKQEKPYFQKKQSTFSARRNTEKPQRKQKERLSNKESFDFESVCQQVKRGDITSRSTQQCSNHEHGLFSQITQQDHASNESTNSKVQLQENIHKVYEFQKLIGEGSYGVVHMAVDKKSLGQARAIKSIKKLKESQFLNEYDSLSQMDHPNIVKLHQVYQDENDYHLDMSFCNGGDLSSYLKNLQGSIKEETCAKIVYQVLKAVSYIHKKGFAHRDIKAENILIQYQDCNDISIQICDFGFCSRIDMKEDSKDLKRLNSFKKMVGSPYYIAPEVIKQAYNEKCDMWSIGILLYFMVTQTFPFLGQCTDDVLESITKGGLVFKQTLWSNYSKDLQDLIKKLVTKSPIIRLSADDALDHPFFSQIKNDSDIYLKKSVQCSMINSFKKNNLFFHLCMKELSQNMKSQSRVSLNKFTLNLDNDNDGLLKLQDLKLNADALSENQDYIEQICFQNKGQSYLSYSDFIALNTDINDFSKQQIWNIFKTLQNPDKGHIDRQCLKNKLKQYCLEDDEFFGVIDTLALKLIKEVIPEGQDREYITFCDYSSFVNKFK
ncbi:protein kinase domain containing protein [Stylonychia lemnae]|uniref:Protein kinase domain containing protein n=1 Tax=Stylonychia lemnae TaxID=5949 RepID=A0A078AUD3_STYLE|nr:protein kinase domain containing protein [Stylonychia lemnae]|eukprot:CDW84463.1 protein kinase domain containing protein [Stylonychia lemnae]